MSGSRADATMPSAGGPRPRILIYCQYVRGIGHLVRASELARAMSAAFEVCLITGGEPVDGFAVPGVAVVQIPAVRRDEESGTLVPVGNGSFDDTMAARARELDRLVGSFAPDVLVTEHFPFGLLFEEELVPVLHAVRAVNPRARIVSSVRDVVASPGGGPGDERTCSLLDEWFDLVLVHGDETLLPFETTFPLLSRIRPRVCYTGYVTRGCPRPRGEGVPRLVASVGGGRVGVELLEAVAAASPLIGARWPHRLVLYPGPFAAPAAAGRLRRLTDRVAGAEVRPFAAGFHTDIAGAGAAVCLGGYNTMLEAVVAAVPTVVYLRPFRHEDREQEVRATRFRDAGLVETIGHEELSPQTVADRVVAALARPAGRAVRAGGQGAAVESIRRLLGAE